MEDILRGEGEIFCIFLNYIVLKFLSCEIYIFIFFILFFFILFFLFYLFFFFLNNKIDWFYFSLMLKCYILTVEEGSEDLMVIWKKKSITI